MELVSDTQESQKNKTAENKKKGTSQKFPRLAPFFFFFLDIKDRKTSTFTMTKLDTKENAANFSKNFRLV